LVGDRREQVLVIFHGVGANGKSTLLGAVRGVLGEYAMHTGTDTLLAGRDGGIPGDLWRLQGARLVSAVEAEAGKKLAESLVKQVTGGDPILAKRLYRDPFEYVPQFQMILATNHKPVIRGTDHAIWRRIRFVPFDVAIPDAEQDKDLPAKLGAESAGILAWMVQGCLAWRREGLGNPEPVRRATAAYRTEMDVLAGFLAECCEPASHAQVRGQDLYESYTEWCASAGERPISQRMLALALAERGYVGGRNRRERFWRGLRLRKARENFDNDEA
jgi:putative DNA primase/helicase